MRHDPASGEQRVNVGMNEAIPKVEIDPMAASPRLEAVWAAIDAAQAPGRQGPYGLFDYTGYGHAIPHHVRDFRDPGSEAYGDCVFRSTDPAQARAVYERLTREHVARAAIRATLQALGLQPLRYHAVAATEEQRGSVRSSEAYRHGDMDLVWANSGDLDMHSHLLPRVEEI
jgi:hypothetical protein